MKGKSPENHRFSHEIWDFPVIFPLNQSIDQQISEENDAKIAAVLHMEVMLTLLLHHLGHVHDLLLARELGISRYVIYCDLVVKKKEV